MPYPVAHLLMGLERTKVLSAVFTGLSVRAGGGGFLPAIRVWCAGYEDRMTAGIKRSQPEVKASKSVKRFQRYRQFKFSMFLPKFLELPGGVAPWTPIEMSNLCVNNGPWAQAWTFWPVMFMVSSSVWVHSRLLRSVQPPIANFPDNPVLVWPDSNIPCDVF